MKNWNEYLTALGARVAGGTAGGAAGGMAADAVGDAMSGTVRDFGRTLGVADLAPGFVAVVSDLGLIAVAGEDAADFLHKQLSNDIAHLGEHQARLAGYCSPKGRLQASLLVWRSAGLIYLQLAGDLQATVRRRLAMFVMRAKAKLSDALAEPACQVTLGFGGFGAEAALRAVFGAMPDAPYAKHDTPSGTLMRLPDAFGAPRYQWLTSAETAEYALPELAGALTLGGNDAWQLAEIHAGIVRITAATAEQFVPQMVNFELLGGVDFKKGCYPGQEIVARSQYLGKLKRRTTLAAIDAPHARAGDALFAADDPLQPCGMVVNAAPNGLGGVDALVEIKLAALELGAVHLGSADGPALAFQAMPYALDALDL